MSERHRDTMFPDLKHSCRLLALAAVALAPPSAMAVSAHPALGTGSHGQGNRYAEGEVLVEFAQPAAAQSSRTAVQEKGDRAEAALEHRPAMAVVKLRRGRSVDEAVRAYRADPRVLHAQPNYRYRAAATPNDPNFSLLWGLANDGQRVNGLSGLAGSDINARRAWDLQTDCSGVIVAVLDTGINYRHADLAVNMWRDPATGAVGRDFVGDNSDNDPMPYGGATHGTHVAGSIAAVGNNGLGTTGVCWSARIMSVRVLDHRGEGFTSDLVEGIAYAVSKGARVLNMSLTADQYDAALQQSLADARRQGAMAVVAAGNDGKNVDLSPTYPCSFDLDNIICVAALEPDFDLANFSNYGFASVDVGAPGVNILSSLPGPRDSFGSTGWQLDASWAVVPGCTSFDVLVNPADWCASGQYANGINARAFKTFDLSGALGGGYGYYADIALNDSGDTAYAAHAPGAGDPLVGGAIDRVETGRLDTPGFMPVQDSLADCAGARCSIGFALSTNGSGRERGVAIGRGYIQKVVDNARSLAYMNGTSMATPHVAGIAALAWTVAPNRPYSEIRTAVIDSGNLLMSLANITSTSRAVEAYAAIVAANQPPSVADASVQTPQNCPVAVGISASDPNRQSLSYGLAEAPANGTVGFSGNVATYSPAGGFVGTDSFTVRVEDGYTGSDLATVDVSVTESGTCNPASAGSITGTADSGGGGGGAFHPLWLLLLGGAGLAARCRRQ